MNTDQPTDLEQKQSVPSTGESTESEQAPSAKLAVNESDPVPTAAEPDVESEALAALWETDPPAQTAEIEPPEAVVEDEPGPATAVDSVSESADHIPAASREGNALDSAEIDLPIETEAIAPIDDEETAEQDSTGVEAPAAVAADTGDVVDLPVVTDIDLPVAAGTDAPVTIEEPTTGQATAVEDSSTAAAAGEATDIPAAESTQTGDKGASKQIHDAASDQKLIAEVEAAPHKVYLLNRVRKAIAAAGESERAAPLKAAEESIVAEIEARKTAKEALCERAEEIKDSTAWRVTGDAFKALFDQWKQVGATGRELDDQLWARFNQARGAFNDRRSKHFEEREIVWSAHRELKEGLCAEAEALADSTAWKATADAIRDLQAKWKAVGSAGREKDEALWARFNTAKQQFFDNRTAAWEENRKRKEALVIDAETLKDSDDWRTAGDAMKAMQTEWKNVGPAGREHEDELWSRFRAATQAFFDRRSSTFAERNQAERDNAAQKIELCVRAEALLYAGDALSAAREAKDLQAQWKEIGPVPREQSEPLWARFREACDKIFANASGERDRQQNEWHIRMREAMTRKREQLSSLRESIAHDEANIERWRESLSTLKPGGKSEEIGKSLEDKIIDVMGRIREKQERAEDLRSSITDIEAKLRE